MTDFNRTPEYVDDSDTPSWGMPVTNPFQKGMPDIEVVDAEFMYGTPSDTSSTGLTEQDLYDPKLYRRYGGEDLHEFHDRFRWDSQSNRWEPRSAHHQELETREYGAIIQYDGLPGGMAAVRATDPQSALKALEAMAALGMAQARRPMLPPATGFAALPAPYGNNRELPPAERAPVALQDIHVTDSPSTATPDTESSAALRAKKGMRDEAERANTPIKHNMPRRTAKALGILALATLPWAYAANIYVQTYENASGKEHSMHIIGKVIPF